MLVSKMHMLQGKMKTM